MAGNASKKIVRMDFQIPGVRDLPTKQVKEFLKNGVNVVTKEKVLVTEPMAMLGFGIVSYM